MSEQISTFYTLSITIVCLAAATSTVLSVMVMVMSNWQVMTDKFATAQATVYEYSKIPLNTEYSDTPVQLYKKVDTYEFKRIIYNGTDIGINDILKLSGRIKYKVTQVGKEEYTLTIWR